MQLLFWVFLTIGLLPPPELPAQERRGGAPAGAAVVIPAGTNIEIRLSEPLSTKKNRSGDRFEAVVDKGLSVDGRVVVPRGSRVTGELLEVQGSGRVKGHARLALTLAEIQIRGTSYPIQVNTLEIEADGTKGRDAKRVGTGIGIGTLIGVITGGGGGAAAGAVIAATGGTAGVLLTKGKEVEFGVEQRFVYSLEKDLEIELP